MAIQVLRYLSLGIFVVAVGYLVWRTVRQVRVQRESYRVLGFGEAGLASAGEGLVNRAQAGLLGLAMGDALGMPRESLPVWLTNLRYGKAPALSRGIFRFMRRRGTVTDDTQLTYVTERSVTDDGAYDDAAFRRMLVAWIPGAIGAGRATMQAAIGWRQGRDRRCVDSQGNGAMMRVFPLAIAFGDVDEMIEVVRTNAESTHPHSEAVAGAEAVARLVSWLLVQPSAREIEAHEWVSVALPRTSSSDIGDWELHLNRAIDVPGPARGLAKIGTSGWVKHTVPGLVYLLAHYGADLDGALREIWAAGGDVDTLAAMYLGCVGVWKGTEAFDVELLESVQGAGALGEEAVRLVGVRRS